jgi:DNA processing protein
VGPTKARKLIETFGTLTEVFRAKPALLRKDGKLTANAVSDLHDPVLRAQSLRDVQNAIALGGKVCVIGDFDYPQRLLRCNDAPIVLFIQGSPELNSRRIISVVGTRNVSAYGKAACARIIAELAPYNPTIVSGLAYGVDICAHREAMRHGLPTVACLAHGLHRIYPSDHNSVAKEMLEQGGWVTEFAPGVQPVRQNFPERNRIIAGISDATLVIESGSKGGSMITARIAASYNREVFALPGEILNRNAAGCNGLIRSNEAALVTHGVHIAEELGWDTSGRQAVQMNLLLELRPEQRTVAQIIQREGSIHIDALVAELFHHGIGAGTIPMLLIEMEMLGTVRQLPGQRFTLTS